ncbi:hypothetical protein RKE29_20795 [Streptomyces sp. B1866]|uniref:DUF4760 domain-containing protein n=1 Tax=Streptomyces sp. B1866 TaxID=3075431 RepID=UPI00288F25F3|nr:hypothetical protein [Streptomyces sp. B1866]MDT3399053.1 hypothetical protein [Streptomyces sp. B1866]
MGEHMYNAATLALSVVALLLSTVAAWRQIRHARSANDFAAVLEVYLRDVRDKDYQRDQDYVVNRLRAEHSPEGGIMALPEQPRNALWNVAFMYESIGMMHELGMMDSRIALGVFHFRVIQVWEAIRPFVQQERNIRQAPFLVFFENLYVKARATPPDDVYRTMGLLKDPALRGAA